MRRSKQNGFSLIELMVSLLIGMVVVAAVGSVAMNGLVANSANSQVLRLNQELRAAMDLMVRDVRRAGHVCNYPSIIGAGVEFKNTATVESDGVALTYQYELCNADRSLASTVYTGYRLESGKLQTCQKSAAKCNVGASDDWVDLTDTNAVKINTLTFCYQPSDPDECLDEPPEDAKVTNFGGQVVVKSLKVTLEGALAKNAATKRKVTEIVMVRNDEVLIP